MTEKKFFELVKKLVAGYTNEHLDKSDGKQISPDDVFTSCGTAKRCRTGKRWLPRRCLTACTMS